MFGSKEQKLKRLVLLVDDDEDIRKLMCLFLKNVGYETDEAVDGVDALDKVNKNLPDVMILDVMMPNMDGITLCKLLRQDQKTKNLPIIILSGKAQPAEIEDGLQAGADRYLTKPDGLNDLTETIEEVLQNSLAE